MRVRATICLLLAVVMTVSLLPRSTFAIEQTESAELTEISSEPSSSIKPSTTPTKDEQAGSQPLRPPVFITEIQVNGDAEFVELYNPADEPLQLTGLSLWYRGGGDSVDRLIDLDTVFIEPHQFAVFGHFTVPGNVTIPFDGALNNSKGEVFIADTSVSDIVLDKVAWGDVGDGYHFDAQPAKKPSAGNSLQRCFSDGTIYVTDPHDTSQEFIVYENDVPTPFFGIECAAVEPPATIVDCSGIVINEIGANIDEQFIELYNPTLENVPLAGCLLQTNRNSKTYSFVQTELAPGAYLSIPIDDTELTLTKTTTGTVYLLTSDGQVETDVRSYSDMDEDSSWSYFDDGWKQTYALTPGLPNTYQEFLPCDDGYFRNEETGRCNKIPVEELLTPCKPGQYRSMETNRCRSFAEAVTRKPCKEGQYRNPETNRCRNVLGASTLKPCKEGQYRNAKTNRCRNLPGSNIPEAAFAVQPIKDSNAIFIGWWALGGVALLAAGYAAWEWRRELASRWRALSDWFASKF